MRELKFRAWDKKTKKIRTVESIGFGELSYNKEGYPVANMIGRDCIHDKDIIIHRDSHQHELMQYTGLKDKNGKEIYEGDIVKHHKLNTITKCIFNEQYITFAFKDNLNEYFYIYIDSKHLEVIGNIYENPNLLEGN